MDALTSSYRIVSPSFAVEVLGDGEQSVSGSDLVSVAVLGVLVVTDVSGTTPSVVTLMCEGVHSGSEWEFVEPQSFSFSKKRKFACVENQEGTNRRMRTPLPQQSSFSPLERRKPLERSRKNGCCKDGAVREQQ